MHGFLNIVGAMVLQSVDELSDEGGRPPAPAPGIVPTSGPTPKSKPKAKPKAKEPKVLKRPAASPLSEPALPLEPAGPPAKKPAVQKKPASKTDGDASKPTRIRKNFYKESKRYGFVVGDSEVMYVASLHLFDRDTTPHFFQRNLFMRSFNFHLRHCWLSSEQMKARAFLTRPVKRLQPLGQNYWLRGD